MLTNSLYTCYGKGRNYQFFATDEELQEIFCAHLPDCYRPYILIALQSKQRDDTNKYYYDPLITSLDSYVNCRKNKHVIYYIASRILTPDISFIDCTDVNDCCATNGFIKLFSSQYTRLGGWMPSIMMLADKAININTEDVITHKEYLSIYTHLKKKLNR